MTGSGSAVFGVFSSAEQVREAAKSFPAARTFAVRFVGRRRYQKAWQ